MGNGPETQARALTGNRTSGPWPQDDAPQSHSGQGTAGEL